MGTVKNVFHKTQQHYRHSFFVLGIDIGGTKISFGIVAFNKNKIPRHKILSYFKIKTPNSRKAIIETIVDIAKTYKKNYTLKGIGISFPCRVDLKGNILDNFAADSTGWKGGYLKKILSEKLNLPVIVNNDGQCFVLGEYNFGIAKKFSNIAGLILGTGVGGGIIINKRIYTGKHNIAGEFGYATNTKKILKDKLVEIKPNGKIMVGFYQMITGKKKNTFEIEKLANDGEKDALMVMDCLAIALADTISSIIYSLDPEAVVLGGGISRVKIMVQKTLEILNGKLSNFLKNTKILTTSLNDKANILGAALFFKERFYENKNK